MRFFKKKLLYSVVSIILIALLALAYITLALPNVGPPENISISLTPQRIARGKYLASHVTVCMDCHSQRDWSKPVGEIAADKLGAGGDDFDASIGIPGDIYVPNITPYKLKNWTDGEIYRALTTGQRKDGSAIFPFMPWPNFAKMSREDLYSIIAYLRTLKPIITQPYPDRKLDFPVNILVHLMPKKARPGSMPPMTDTVNYGKYLFTSASCNLCHSQKNNGNIIPELALAGGVGFNMGNKTIYSANITPDKATGIGNWTRDAFVQVFKSYTLASKLSNSASKPQASPMPWYDYGGMDEADLRAIYTYLRTVKPVHNKVNSW